MITMDTSYWRRSIYNILDGLSDGLSHFAGPSRVALLICLEAEGPFYILDPQNLLDGHQPRLKDLDATFQETTSCNLLPEFNPSDDPQLSGLIAYGGSCTTLPFQMWFTEEHPDICSKGPTLRWLEYAATQLCADFGQGAGLRNDTSSYVLQGYAQHAIRDYIIDKRSEALGMDTYLRIYPTLNAILGISNTREEGAWPRGNIAFVEPRLLQHVHFQASFPRMEQPLLVNLRHCRKTLQAVENTERFLISDGCTLAGVASGDLPPGSILATFEGNHGMVKLDDELICSFASGNFLATNRRPNLVQLEEALLESSLTPKQQHNIFHYTTRVVVQARERKHGCTLVLDLNTIPRNIAGQTLQTPLDLSMPENIDIACSLAKVDGALHISKSSTLLGFACLLDGRTVPGENRARGARFNSAVRFTAMHKNIITIVVSSDRPVSVIQHGIELTAQCRWKPISYISTPPRLTDWLEE